MSFESASRLLVTMIVVLAFLTSFRCISFAQIPEAPGTYIEPDGNVQHPVEIPRGGPRKVQATATPDVSGDSARDTLNIMERSRARASGTPLPEPSPHAPD